MSASAPATSSSGWLTQRFADNEKVDAVKRWRWQAWGPRGSYGGYTATKEEAVARAEHACANLKAPLAE